MISLQRWLALVAVLFSISESCNCQQYTPGDNWRESTPEKQGVDSRPLVKMLEFIRTSHVPIHSIVVVRHGYVVLDVSFFPYSSIWPHDVASVTKSVTSLLTGIAVDQGVIPSANRTIASLLPEYAGAFGSPVRRQITVANLLTMTSGLDCKLDEGEMALRKMQQADDWAAFALSLPIVSEPGSHFAYCSPNCHLLSAILSSRTNRSEFELATQYLFRPLRIEDLRWGADPQGRTTGWGGLHLKPRDMAKLGYLYLQNGTWGNRQIISSSWVQSSIEPHAEVRSGVAYGYSWWINTEHTPPIFEAEGRGGQRISVIRDKDTVITFLGGGEDTDVLAPFLLNSLKSDRELPPNPKENQKLRSLVRQASEPLPGHTIHPFQAARLASGRTLKFEPNLLHLEQMTFESKRLNTPRILLRMAGQTYEVPIGPKGHPALSKTGPFGLPLATQGSWDTRSHLILDIDTVANINHYLLDIDLDSKAPIVNINEVTGELSNYKVQAHLE